MCVHLLAALASSASQFFDFLRPFAYLVDDPRYFSSGAPVSPVVSATCAVSAVTFVETMILNRCRCRFMFFVLQMLLWLLPRPQSVPLQLVGYSQLAMWCCHLHKAGLPNFQSVTFHVTRVSYIPRGRKLQSRSLP